MTERKRIINAIEKALAVSKAVDGELIYITCGEAEQALELLKEQEPRELTKNEWQLWKKDKRRNPICMVFEGDTTPFWVISPEYVNEVLYLMGKIKLFTNKPEKEEVKPADRLIEDQPAKPREERHEVYVSHVWGDEIDAWSEFCCPQCGAMIAKGKSEHYPRCMWYRPLPEPPKEER